MKLTHLALAVLMASSITTTGRAAELANPVPGAVVRHFNWKADWRNSRDGHERRFVEQIPEFLSGAKAAAETGVDTAESFNTHAHGDRRTSIWDGYIKSASGGVFTFTFGFNKKNIHVKCFSVWINGQQLMLGSQKVFYGNSDSYAFSVALRPGFNSIRIILEADSLESLLATYKKTDSLQAPRNIGPGDLWHEDVVEDEEW